MGQSTVEFALIIPLVLVVILGVVQVGVVVANQLGVSNTAHEIARRLAREPGSDLEALVAEVTTLPTERLEIRVTVDPSTATGRDLVLVTVTLRDDAVLSLFQPILDSFEIVGSSRVVSES